jgi:hypothetical protein
MEIIRTGGASEQGNPGISDLPANQLVARAVSTFSNPWLSGSSGFIEDICHVVFEVDFDTQTAMPR